MAQSKPTLVKFYRDYSIADFSFCAFITLIIGYNIFQPTLPLGVCEGLSQHPDLMRDMAELGLSSENCERWFKRSSLVFLAVMLVILVARVSLILQVLRAQVALSFNSVTVALSPGRWHLSLPPFSPSFTTHTCSEQYTADPHSISVPK